jgi:hypothetical protein
MGSLRVDDEQPRALPAYLAAEDQVDVELELVALERGPIQVGHAPDLLADDPRRVVERRRLGEALALIEVAPELRDDRLGAGEASTAQQNEHPLARLLEEVHLAGDVHLIVAGVGA